MRFVVEFALVFVFIALTLKLLALGDPIADIVAMVTGVFIFVFIFEATRSLLGPRKEGR